MKGREVRIGVLGLSVVLLITACASSVPDITGELNQTEIIGELSDKDIVATPVLTVVPEPTSTVIPEQTDNVTTESSEVASPEPTEEPTAAVTPEPTVAPTPTVIDNPEPTMALTQEQINSLAMLNYLAVLLQKVTDSKNNKIALEEAYSSLENNTDPAMVDEETQGYVKRLFNTIQRYRMIEIKRERLRYINEKNKAKAIKEAVPNPVGLLSAVSSFRLEKIAASVVYMAIDSVTSYNAYKEQIEEEYLQSGWALDDEEMDNLHISRMSAFDYMVNIVRSKEITKDYSYMALNAESVREFVAYSQNQNLEQRLRFFESHADVYDTFAPYWLELVKCYYEKGDDEKCIKAMEQYEELQTDIFRYDYNYAKYIPFVILAAERYYSKNDYMYSFATFANKYTKLLLENAKKSDWTARYFAAQTYIKIYHILKDDQYLEEAYEIIKDSINNGLIAEQQKMNSTYIDEVKEVIAPDDVDGDEEDSIEDYNEAIKEKRKTELPPVYEPLVINLDLLFSLSEKLNKDQNEKESINKLLHGSSTPLFLSKVLDERYTYGGEETEVFAYVDDDYIGIPVEFLTENSRIEVVVTDSNGTNTYTDWVVDEVKRPSSDISDFRANFKSEEYDDQEWEVGTEVKIRLIDDTSCDEKSYTMYATVKEMSWRPWPMDNVPVF